MNVASVTVTAMNHGLTRWVDACFSVRHDRPSQRTLYRWLDRHARPQQVLWILILIEPDPHRESLHHLHVISGRIFRRKQAEERTGGAWKALDFALDSRVRTCPRGS